MKHVFLFGEREKRANYVEALESCGALVTVSQDTAAAPDCQALLLPGGADMDPALYGAENQGSRGIDRQLDETELALCRAFAAQGKPILGICRGLQVLNVAFGGDLVQDLPTAASHCWLEDTGDQAHPVTAPEGSFLRLLYGEAFGVNSAHHQAAGRVAPCFTVAAQAADGVAEALAWPEKRIYAVQFHPERMTLRHRRPDTADGRALFQFFLSQVG